MRIARGLVVFALATAPAGAHAQPAQRPAKPPTEEQRAADVIGRALKTHGPDVHRCFEKTLADRLDVAGQIEVELALGAGGKVTAAKVLSQAQDVPASLSTCVVTAANGWTLAGLDPGAVVVLPFTFAGQNDQFVVRGVDVPARGPSAGKARGGKAQAPFTVKILIDPENVRAPKASLTLLTVGPASRVAMHRHPNSAKVLYLAKGHARVLGPAGAAPIKLDEGGAVYLPAGYPHVIENMGRQADAVFLQAFSPPGPERVFRDPQNEKARLDFEVIREPSSAKPPAGKPVVASVAGAKPLPILGGKATARILFDDAATGATGTASMALDVIEFGPGAEGPRHDHPASSEILHILSGPGGTVTVGSESMPIGAGDTMHVGAGQPHAGKFSAAGTTIAVQIYAPAGPEQRFHNPPGAPAPAPTK